MGLSDHSLAGRTAGKALGVQIGSGCGGVKAGLVCRGWWVGGQGLPVAKVGGQHWRVVKGGQGWPVGGQGWSVVGQARFARWVWPRLAGGWPRLVGGWPRLVGGWLAKGTCCWRDAL